MNGECYGRASPEQQQHIRLACQGCQRKKVGFVSIVALDGVLTSVQIKCDRVNDDEGFGAYRDNAGSRLIAYRTFHAGSAHDLHCTVNPAQGSRGHAMEGSVPSTRSCEAASRGSKVW